MKITATYRTSRQITESDWVPLTRVVHVLPTDTVVDIVKKVRRDHRQFYPNAYIEDFELHITEAE